MSFYGAEHDTIVSEFNDMIDKHCLVQAVCGRQFILVSKLKCWLRDKDTSSPTQKDPPTRIYRLAEAAYRERLENVPGVPLSKSALIDEYSLTFCILFRLNRGHLINEIQRQGLVDDSFPMPRLDLEEKIKSVVPNDEQLLQEFYKLQWAFFPPVLKHGMDKNFLGNDYVFPVVKKARINKKGLTARLWQIAVPEEFVEKSLRDQIEGSAFEDKIFGKCYQVALKSFKQGHGKYFYSEKEAFDAVREHEGVVKYLGNFDRKERKYDPETDDPISHINDPDGYEMTHNIILQYGNCDLQDYFYENYPPQFKAEITEFWDDLFRIAHTSRKIHNLKIPHSEKGYRGLHADIKPLNILNVAGKFKLADLGFMTFVKDEGEPMAVASPGGTWTYGSPEQQQPGMPVTQATDIWSLACVFSVAATWVALGPEGIVVFQKAREKLNEQLQFHNRTDAIVVEAGDAFHDGTRVLSTVLEWHKLLRQSIRKSDCITEHILDLIDDRMLLGSPKERISAEQLCVELEAIVLRAEKGVKEHITPEIKAALLDHDNSAPIDSNTRTSLAARMANHPTSWEQRQIRKVDLKKTTYLKKTSRRSATLQPALGPIITGPRMPENGVNGSFHIPINSSSASRHRHRHNNSIVPNDERNNSPFYKPKDVFQVRETQDYANLISHFFDKFSRDKDKALSDHFKDRDIKFLVDNAESMKKWWARVKFFLEILVRKTAKEDDDGVDIAFTIGNETIKKLRKWDQRKKEFIKTLNNAQPADQQVTNIDVALRKSFDSHLEYLKTKQHSSKTRALTLIVLTDGLWVGTPDKEVSVKKLIAKFFREVRTQVGSMMPYPVSIEFVQFGRDIDARVLFLQLDDDLKSEEQIEDVIDTEYWDGDVYKILLGSFVPHLDSIMHQDSVVISP